jgi:hypothetical protein
MAASSGDRFASKSTAPVTATLAPHQVVAFAQNSTSAALWARKRRRKRGVMYVAGFTGKSARDRDERQGPAHTRECAHRIAH